MTDQRTRRSVRAREANRRSVCCMFFPFRRWSFRFAGEFTVEALLEGVDRNIFEAAFCKRVGGGIEDRCFGGILSDGFTAGAEIAMDAEGALRPADD